MRQSEATSTAHLLSTVNDKCVAHVLITDYWLVGHRAPVASCTFWRQQHYSDGLLRVRNRYDRCDASLVGLGLFMQ